MKTSEQIGEIAAALAKAQGAIEGAVKGNINPHFKSKYADLGAVWDACREPLAKNDIAVLQPVSRTDAGTLITITRLVHASGQWMQDDGIPLLLSKEDMQGLGSALTYSRRYGLMSMVGIAPEDDDAEAAVRPAPTQAARQTVAEPKGYTLWLADLTAVADEGVEPLKKTWVASRPEFRQYLTKVSPESWEGLKARAQQKDPVSA